MLHFVPPRWLNVICNLPFQTSLFTHHLTGARLQTVKRASLLISWLRSWLQSERGRSCRQAITSLILGLVVGRWRSGLLLVAGRWCLVYLVGFQFHRFREATGYGRVQWKEHVLIVCLLHAFIRAFHAVLYHQSFGSKRYWNVMSIKIEVSSFGNFWLSENVFLWLENDITTIFSTVHSSSFNRFMIENLVSFYCKYLWF